MERPFGGCRIGRRCLKPYLSTHSKQFGYVQGFAKRLTECQPSLDRCPGLIGLPRLHEALGQRYMKGR